MDLPSGPGNKYLNKRAFPRRFRSSVLKNGENCRKAFVYVQGREFASSPRPAAFPSAKDPALVHLLETNVHYVPEPWCSRRQL